MIETLLTGDLTGRLRAVEEAMARAEGPSRVEAALPDLLREGEDELLEAVARGLGARAGEEAARRVLETLARRGGLIRVAALNALRGQATSPGTPSLRAGSQHGATSAGAAPTSAAAASAAAAPSPASLSNQPVAATGGGRGADGSPRDEAAWQIPFEVLLSGPTRERIAEAALALVDLSDARPPGATRETLQALAGRLAIASFEHEGDLQAGLARLAKGLKALA